MVKVNIQEAKTYLSRYAKRVKAGETVILCDRNVPFGEIRPLARSSRRERKFGLYAGQIAIADDFDAPMVEFESDFYAHAKPARSKKRKR